MMRRDEVVYVSFSGSLNVMNDVHYTEITHVTLLHAGDKVVVYDRDAHEIFPQGAKEVTTEAWADAQETEIPDCTSVADVIREKWRGSWFRCPQCECRQRAGVLRCLAPHCGMEYDDVAAKMGRIVEEKQSASLYTPDPLTRRPRSVGPKQARTGPAPSLRH